MKFSRVAIFGVSSGVRNSCRGLSDRQDYLLAASGADWSPGLGRYMKLCDLTLASPLENLACDEVLLDLAEQGETGELLRLWEPAQYFVVLGYGNKAEGQAYLPFCRHNNIPVLRRCSGGGTVLQGPGCLNFSLLLSAAASGAAQNIAATNELILKRHAAALTALLQAPVEIRAPVDLAIGGVKFAGNAQRRRKHFLLFHGTFLLNLDISLMAKALPMPSSQPAYRLSRSHADFVMNLKMPAQRIKLALQKTWKASEPLLEIPFEAITRLAEEKYGRDEWNLKF